MFLGLREFEALGGKFEEQDCVRKSYRYAIYKGILTIDQASCIGYVKKCKNGAVFVVKMQNLLKQNESIEKNTAQKVLTTYLNREETNESVLKIQKERSRFLSIATAMRTIASLMILYTLYKVYETMNFQYLWISAVGALVVIVLNECKYAILGMQSNSLTGK